MPETLYPKRQRCKNCRSAFKETVVDGLYCSYKCAKIKAPSPRIDDAPRSCKREVNGKWGWKTRYTHIEQVPQKLQNDPGTNIYRCDYCHHLHVGHSRAIEYEEESLKRTVQDAKTLGSVILRYREQKKIDKKTLAKALGVPAIRITEVEEGNPKMSAVVLFKILNQLRIQVEITGR